MRTRPLYEKGIRNELMRLLLTNGVLSYDGLHMMKKEHRLYTRKLKEMTQEGIVQIKRVGKKKYAVLNNFSSTYQKYIEYFAPGYYGYYMRYGHDNGTRIDGKDVSRSERISRSADVLQIMHGAEVRCFFDEKQDLRDCNEAGFIFPQSEEENCYYNSIELKEFTGYRDDVVKENEEDNVIVNSRAVGLLVTTDSEYLVYRIKKEPFVWKKSGESKMAYVSGRKLKENKPDTDFINPAIKDAILLADNVQVFEKLCDRYSKKNQGKLCVNSGFERLYVLPFDEKGKNHLKLMQQTGWKKKIKEHYYENQWKENNRKGISCDGVSIDEQKEQYLLLFCIPDIIKLLKFISVAELSDEREKFIIYCYEYQLPLVSVIAHGKATIFCEPLENYIQETENT